MWGQSLNRGFRSTGTVSYTHLDVYKRQALVRALEQEHGDAWLEELERAVEEVMGGDGAGALPLHLLEDAPVSYTHLKPIKRLVTAEKAHTATVVLRGPLESHKEH